MDLLVHIGLHKTASTYLQHVMNDNAAAMAAAGVWYEPQPGYPAHHQAAWRVLLGDATPVEVMIEHAREAQCQTMILSSEDLEGALYDERPLAALAALVERGLVDRIVWHVVLREPGACFSSLYAQLQHHVYYDSLTLFYDAMVRGFVHIERPMPEEGTPYWFYAFDHLAILERFNRRMQAHRGQRLVAHDYRDATPYPGWRILEGAGALGAISQLPGPEARNARLDDQAVAQGYVQRILDAVPQEADQQAIMVPFTDALRASLAGIATYAPLVGQRYASSHAQALLRFGRG